MASMLCMLVQASLAAGDVERGREVLDALAADPRMLATEALKAMHRCPEAELALHDREYKVAALHLRRAARHWREAGSPVGEAETRVRLAECLLKEGDAAGTEFELHALEAGFASIVAVHSGRRAALRNALKDPGSGSG